MIQCVWYNDDTKRKANIQKNNKGDLKMSGDLRYINAVMNSQNFGESKKGIRNKKENVSATKKEMPLVHESCNFSGFSMVAVAGALLLFAGIFLYALVV